MKTLTLKEYGSPLYLKPYSDYIKEHVNRESEVMIKDRISPIPHFTPKVTERRAEKVWGFISSIMP